VNAAVERLVAAGRTRAPAARRIRSVGILIPFAILFAVLALTSSSFATRVNLLNILDQQSATLIIAAAGTLVLVAGGIDLSVGATYSLAGVVSAHFALHTNPVVAIALGIGAGLLVGLANGLITTAFRINALITTLAMSFVVGGLASLIAKGNLLVLFDKPGFGKLARTEIAGVKSSIWLMVAAVVVIGFVLSATVAGRYMFAAGGNAQAARLAGVRVDGIRVLTFAVSGTAAGLAGVIDTSRVLSAQASTATRRSRSPSSPGSSSAGRASWAARAPCGGRSSASSSSRSIGNGYILLGLDPLYEQITMGAILLAAVGLDALTRRGT
jgi:ribose transport system permease protein